MNKNIKLMLLTGLLFSLAACSGNANRVKKNVWKQNPVEMCSSLIAQNKEAVNTIVQKYGENMAREVAPLYQELDLRTNAICRSRITQQMQIERIKALRAEYLKQINEKIKGSTGSRQF